MPIKQIIKANLKNILWGKRVPQKMVIFESDDWGSNYIAGKEEFNQLVKAGILSENSSTYARYDTIARPKDLEMLFETLSSVKDANGNPAVFSTFFAPVNPDFEKIAATDFQEYHYETFLETLSKTGEDKAVASLWKTGINDGMISPAYHAREHLCVPLWMEHLQNNHKKVREAFKHRFYSVEVDNLPDIVRSFRPALYFNDNNQKEQIGLALIDGINILQHLFNKKFSVFAPPNGVSHPYFNSILVKNGIDTIHNSKPFVPDGSSNGRIAKKDLFVNSVADLSFYNRNCRFEPTQVKDDLSKCLIQIQGAFNWNKPAIISTHRVNYMGAIDAENRENSIRQLKILLNTIIKKWPDVIFASSEDYSKILHNK